MASILIKLFLIKPLLADATKMDEFQYDQLRTVLAHEAWAVDSGHYVVLVKDMELFSTNSTIKSS